MSNKVASLRKTINRVSDPFSNGDVIRWRFKERYTYAALRANGQWWLTGRRPETMTYANLQDSYSGRVLSYDELTSILSRPDVDQIVVCQSWELVSE